jgi:hypothetical protein
MIPKQKAILCKNNNSLPDFRNILCKSEYFLDDLTQFICSIVENNGAEDANLLVVLRCIKNMCIECSDAQIKVHQYAGPHLFSYHSFVANVLQGTYGKPTDEVISLAIESAANMVNGRREIIERSPLITMDFLSIILSTDNPNLLARGILLASVVLRVDSMFSTNENVLTVFEIIVHQITTLVGKVTAINSSCSLDLLEHLIDDPYFSLLYGNLRILLNVAFERQFLDYLYDKMPPVFHCVVLLLLTEFSKVESPVRIPAPLLDKIISNYVMNVRELVNGSLNTWEATALVKTIQFLNIYTLSGRVLAAIQPTIQLLDHLHKLRPPQNLRHASEAVANAENENLDQSIPNSIFQVKKVLLLVIAQLAYNCCEAQDCIRESGGLPIILDNCKYDENQPCTCFIPLRAILISHQMGHTSTVPY